METVQSWLLTSWDPCCQHNHYEPFLLMVFSGELFTRTIHKFKTEYLLIWQKVLEYLDKYQVLWPSSTSKYQVLLNFKRSSTSKYQVLNNLHQVPSTSTLLDPNPDTLRPGQDGCQFPDNFFKRIFLNKNVRIYIEFHWSLFLRVQLTIFQYWFR